MGLFTVKSVRRWAWLAAIAVSVFCATCGKTPPGASSVSIQAEAMQPVGMPVIIEVEICNTGAATIDWLCGVGSRLPGPLNFQVETRHEQDAAWTRVQATNGESEEGSARVRKLGVGDSLRVPLAVPVRPQSVAANRDKAVYMDTLHVRVTCGLVPAPNVAEVKVALYHDAKLSDKRQLEMIHGITDPEPSFWTHVAHRYPDAAVLDTAFLLAGTGNGLVVNSACRVLEGQPTLPEERGVELANLVLHWSKIDHLGGPLVAATLATQSEIARQTVLSLLVQLESKISRSRILYALKLSPGNAEWLRRVRSTIVEVEKAPLHGQDLSSEIRAAIEWIDDRLQSIKG